MLGALALGGITYALIGAGDDLLRADVLGAAASAWPSAAAFVVRERRAARPDAAARGCSPTGSSPAPTSRTLAVYGALGGCGLFLVLQLQTVLGYDATAAGAAMLPSIAADHPALARAGDAGHRGSAPGCR